MSRLVVALCLLVMGTTGCAKIREKLGRKTSGGTESPTAALSSATTPSTPAPPTSATSSVTIGKLPDGWPASIPPYPGATILSASTSPSGKSIMLRTRDSSLKVREYYMDRFASMKLHSNVTIPSPQAAALGPSTVMSFKDTDSIITLSIAPTTSHETTVTVSIAPKG